MTKKILKDLQINEISFVDRPAQKGAKMAIMKRDNPEIAAIAKYYTEHPPSTDFKEILESKERNQKLWEVRDEIYPLTNALSESIDAIVSDESISMSNKTPRIEANITDFLSAIKEKLPEIEDEITKLFDADFISKIQKENQMSDNVEIEEIQKSLDETKAALETAQAELAKAEALAAMSDDEKTFIAKMDDKEKEAFAALSDKEKKEKMDGVKKSDETLVIEGSEIRKSEVGDAQFAIFKSLSDKAAVQEAAIAKAEKETAFVKFEKRASDELGNLPGKDIEKAKVLEAAADFSEEVLKSFDAILKAANEALSGAFDTIGKATGEVDGDTQSKIDKAAKEIQKRDGISEAAAIAKAWEENPELYEESN